MTMAIGSQSGGHMKKSSRNDNGRSGNKSNSSSSGGGGGGGSSGGGGVGGVGSGGNNGVGHCESESDTSISPSTEFSNMPTYRVPCKSRNSDGRSGVGVYFHTHKENLHTYTPVQHTRLFTIVETL